MIIVIQTVTFITFSNTCNLEIGYAAGVVVLAFIDFFSNVNESKLTAVFVVGVGVNASKLGGMFL